MHIAYYLKHVESGNGEMYDAAGVPGSTLMHYIPYTEYLGIKEGNAIAYFSTSQHGFISIWGLDLMNPKHAFEKLPKGTTVVFTQTETDPIFHYKPLKFKYLTAEESYV